MTLATKITIARIVLIVPTVVFYIVGMLAYELYLPFLIVSCVLFALLCSTDFVDGYIARKTGTVSALGKFLDPLADKIVIVVMLFLIVYFRDFELFEYDILVIALLAADIFGKVKTVLLDVGVAFLILAGVNDVIMWIGEIVFFAGALLTVYSGIRYMVRNKKVLADVSAAGNGTAESSEESAETETDDAETENAEAAAQAKDGGAEE